MVTCDGEMRLKDSPAHPPLLEETNRLDFSREGEEV